MFCVVPLAGPDLYDPRYGAKPFVPCNGRTLIEATLGARPWLASGALKSADIVFVLRELEQSADILARLRSLFPGCHSVVVDRLTAGTVFSALAGAALQQRFDEPLVIDLVDIIYRCPDVQIEQLLADPRVAGAIPWFRSADPAYSYLRVDDHNVIETAGREARDFRACLCRNLLLPQRDLLHDRRDRRGGSPRAPSAERQLFCLPHL
jgi:hypothetical protein